MKMPTADAARAIAQAEALLIGAGAGMGVDSGLPDFRGNEGFWKAYPPFAKLGLSFVDMANPSWFTRDPALAWGFYGHRLDLYRRTSPHHGFAILLRWMQQTPGGGFVFTSNVDGQFQRAGTPDACVAECHGSIHHLQCAAQCQSKIWGAGGCRVSVDETTFRARPPLPKCPECGGIARPNILMFGDGLWLPQRTDAQESALEIWLAGLDGRRLVIIELGAGTAVPTVRMTCERIARRCSAPLIRITPRESHGPRGTISLPVGARRGLGDLAAVLGSAPPPTS